MGVRKTFTRDEMRAFLTILKEQLDVEYSTKNLSNVEKCKAAIKDIVNIYTDRIRYADSCRFNPSSVKFPREDLIIEKLIDENGHLDSEIYFLKGQIEELKKKLKNKKWWEFWK